MLVTAVRPHCVLGATDKSENEREPQQNFPRVVKIIHGEWRKSTSHCELLPEGFPLRKLACWY